ncbi:MAG: hypothetical protein NXI04_15085 [Planctomycetaceae bacterium]|nr:hypothetical protein [Planctomycetaceae bacterium]
MAEEIRVSGINKASGQQAMLVDDGVSAWLYLHAPAWEGASAAAGSGPVIATALAYNRVQPIAVADVKNYRPGPPPIAIGYASEIAVCETPDQPQWTLAWSASGDSVMLARDGQPWCFITPEYVQGCSKAVEKSGPWGAAWTEDAYADIEWTGS